MALGLIELQLMAECRNGEFELLELADYNDVELRPPYEGSWDAPISKTLCGRHLPPLHQEVLSSANGVLIFGGYYKLFGIEDNVPLDIQTWNTDEYWKFAWERRATDFLCFGTSAWGDQYAYHLSSLEQGQKAAVFQLDAFSMEAEKIANSFDEFWEKEFLRNARTPYDSMVINSRQKLGKIKWNELLAFDPPLLLGGTEDTSQSVKMNARSVMIANGDLVSQLDSLPDHAKVMGVKSYIDSSDRARIKVLTNFGT